MSNSAQAGQTFEPHREKVYAWAFRITGSHHDALDIVQDVFLSWLRQMRRCLPDRPGAWLRRTTVNQAIDLLRARRKQGRTLDLGRAGERAPTVQPCIDPEQKELRADLAEGLARLTEAQRTVLIAKEYDGLTFARVAEETGLSISTVKTHYLRALTTLRDLLAKRWKPERSKE
jgi:RNA polymerase sigma-70 factor (ECF subfamily)